MKVLIVTYHYLNGNGGGIYGSRATINALAEIADDVTLVYPMKPGAEPEEINHSVHLIPVWDKRSKLRKGLDLLFGDNNRFKSIERYISGQSFDIVLFDTSMVVPGIINYFKNKGVKIITVHHNYQYEYYRDNVKGLLRMPTLKWAKRCEKAAVRGSDVNLTVTECDKEQLIKHYGTGNERFEVIGSFDYKREVHRVYPEVNESAFLITGALDSIQTEDSLIVWLDTYYPILRQVFPAASLTIAGKNPTLRLLQKIKKCGARLIPSPESMIPVLAEAKYYVCPTSLGSGIKLRVRDGLRAGLSVICHEVSARGYEQFVKEGILLTYNDVDSFKTGLDKLKRIDVCKEKVLSIYEQLFSFDSGKQRFVDLLSTL